MKLFSVLFGISAITSPAMAAPAEEVKQVTEATEATDATEKAAANNWDWCAPNFTVSLLNFGVYNYHETNLCSAITFPPTTTAVATASPTAAPKPEM